MCIFYPTTVPQYNESQMMKYVQILTIRHWWYHIPDQGSITRALALCLFQVFKFSTLFTVFIPTLSTVSSIRQL